MAAKVRTVQNEGIGLARVPDMNIPQEFTFGVEIELLFPTTVDDITRRRWTPNTGPAAGWIVKTDNSIQCSPNAPAVATR
jgi:hypothetical protein